MGPKPLTPKPNDLFRQRLDELVNLRHPLVQLAEHIDWSVFEREWAGLFPSQRGRPALPPRLIAGLLYLQHTFGLSDDDVVWGWVENPYWQLFCGETWFQHQPPIDPSSLTRWRKRIGEEGLEWLLTQTIRAAESTGVVKRQSFDKVIVDSTVQEKAIAHPTDSRLLNRGREQLVKLAAEAGLTLRQNYNREAPKLAGQIGRYAHARQFKRMRSSLKKLKTLVGRVWRDVSRQVARIPAELQDKSHELLHKVERLLTQQKKDKNKLYSLHAPEVECISKGKARQPYEFGVKVSVATTHQEGLVIGMRSLPGNPYDGHTLHEALEQLEILTDHCPKEVFVDLGYRGHTAPDDIKVYHRNLKRGITSRLKRDIKRRSAIEPVIGHMKNDGRLRRNWLKGAEGDAFHALLCGCGHNLRLILKKLRLLCALIWLVCYRRLIGRGARQPQFAIGAM
ncbi:IS5 family transposase [Chitinilyticum piscinae]|uniref:IS5 family transposase n=1 Tax=Chitinilyticum piscinae TaxID=2866724 RepID=UPI001D16F7E3|nr:IS5 family transposase [Chitinilyticum piscinae]